MYLRYWLPAVVLAALLLELAVEHHHNRGGEPFIAHEIVDAGG